MFSFTLENLKIDQDENLYNIFRQTYIDSNKIILHKTFVKTNENMRLDIISERLYGTFTYIEELMQLNNIINVWNIKEGDVILYCPTNNFEKLKALEKELDAVIANIATPNKDTRIDENRNKNVPPTIKPKSLQNLTLDKKNKKIKIQGKIS